MTLYEKAEIKRLPKKYRPMGATAYILYSILYIIPLIGWAFLIFHALNKRRICRRSFARAFACALILALIMMGVMLILNAANSPLIGTIKSLLIKVWNFVFG